MLFCVQQGHRHPLHLQPERETHHTIQRCASRANFSPASRESIPPCRGYKRYASPRIEPHIKESEFCQPFPCGCEGGKLVICPSQLCCRVCMCSSPPSSPHNPPAHVPLPVPPLLFLAPAPRPGLLSAVVPLPSHLSICPQFVGALFFFGPVGDSEDTLYT